MTKKKKGEKIVRYSSRELQQVESRTDWGKVDRLTDKQIDKGSSNDPDAAPPLTEDWFKKAAWVRPPKKEVHLRLDSDILSFFKQKGKGYQTRINQVLRAFMEAHS